MSNSIAVEKRSSFLIIRFTRPEIRNPLSVSVLEELDRILDTYSALANVEKLIFTGTGNAFASGADLREIADVTAENAREFSLRGQNLMSKIAAVSIPTLAAINGFCFGGALDLALACRHRIASPDASFAHPGTKLGIITGWSGTQRLPRLIGQANALEMFYTAEPVSAFEALRIGLVNQIAEDPLVESMANRYGDETSKVV